MEILMQKGFVKARHWDLQMVIQMGILMETQMVKLRETLRVRQMGLWMD